MFPRCWFNSGLFVAAEHGVATPCGQGAHGPKLLAMTTGIFPCIRGRDAPTSFIQRPYTSGPVSIGEQDDEHGANRILDDFAKLMTDAAGAAQGVRREMETAFRRRQNGSSIRMDIVKREEFEAVREMAVKARDENDALLARIAALEARLDGESR